MQHARILLIEEIGLKCWKPILGDETLYGSKNCHQDDPRLTWKVCGQQHQHHEEYQERYKCIHV